MSLHSNLMGVTYHLIKDHLTKHRSMEDFSMEYCLMEDHLTKDASTGPHSTECLNENPRFPTRKYHWITIATHRWLVGIGLGLLMIAISTLGESASSHTDTVTVIARRAKPDKAIHHLYQISLIVFRQYNRTNLNAEKWPYVIPDRDMLAQLPLLPNVRMPNKQPPKDENPNTTLSTSTTTTPLTPLIQALQQASRYTVIYSRTWRQFIPKSSSNKQQAQSYHLYGGQYYDINTQALHTPTSLTPTRAYQPEQHWEMDGTLTLTHHRYFNAKLNLFFTVPLPVIQRYTQTAFFQGSANPRWDSGKRWHWVYFQLKQNHRIRRDTLNYIDFPLYGVLIKIQRSA